MSEFRKRVLQPALIPLGAFAFIGALAYAVSRILLAVTKEGSVVVATLMAACILFAAAAVAKGGVMKQAQKISLIAFSLLLLGGGIAVEASLGTRPIEGHIEVAEHVAADDLKFDKATLALPADRAFAIEFENKEAQPHNIAIYTDKGGEELFKGSIFTGPATREYEVEPLQTGVYYFQCDVHPTTMFGTATAGDATVPTPPPGAPAPTSAPTSPSPSPSPTAT